MGFIKKNYVNERMGIELPEAYARICDISVDGGNNAQAIFIIQQSREATYDKQPIDGVVFNMCIDRSKPVYEQIYSAAKESIFSDWEDDIPAEPTVDAPADAEVTEEGAEAGQADTEVTESE